MRAKSVFAGGGSHKHSGPRRWPRRFKRPLRHDIPNLMLSDTQRIKQEVPEFQDGIEYTPRELLLLAEKMLLEDPKPIGEDPAILLAEHLRHRQAHEIYNANGIPDPSIQSGLYWRTHPQGRNVDPHFYDKAKGRSFYR